MKGLAFRLTDSELDEVNAMLREYQRNSDLTTYGKGGELILERFFGGSVQAWEDASPTKRVSIRKLAQRPGAPHGKDALTRRVGVHVALLQHGFAYDCPTLTAAHVIAVLRLPTEAQGRFLRLAANERWSAHELRRKVVAERRSAGELRGAPRKAATSLALTRLSRGVQTLEEAQELLQAAERLDASLGAMHAKLAEIRWVVARIRSLLDDADADDRTGPTLVKTAGKRDPQPAREVST